MPLSENEQRLLEQMERALYAEDPKFASAMRGGARRNSTVRRLALGLGAVVVGLGLLVFGVAQKQVWLGVAGFVVMLGGAVFALSSQRKGPVGVVGQNGTVTPTSRRRKGTFMRSMEERWERRREQD